MRKLLTSLFFFCLYLSSFAQVNQKTFTFLDGQLDSGSVMRRYDILFDVNKATFRPGVSIVLDSLVDWLLLHPEFTVEVSQHMDYYQPKYSQNLTQARSKAVCDYFIAHEVPQMQIIPKGYGATRNIISQTLITAEKNKAKQDSMRAINRRVDFKIVRIDPKLMHQFTLQDTVFWPGEVFRSYNIIFDVNASRLRPESLPYLDTLVIFLKAHPQLKIEIGCHTDTRGSLAYNHKLSKMRADWVVDYFIKQGISAERIVAKGYGESLPLVPETESLKAPNKEAQEKMHSLNRRTEFKIISIQ
jgi:outer membrane protein OmpA-like peptidoglycan-associated protein